MNSSSTAATAPALPQRLQQLQQAFAQGRLDEVQRGSAALAASQASAAELLAASQVYQQLGDFDAMLACADRASRLAPGDVNAASRVVECQIYRGRIDLARERLAAMEAAAQQDARLLQHIATLWLHAASHAEAQRCYERAAQLQPDEPGTLYNLATSLITMGDIARAEALYARMIALRPDDFDAYQNRATLRVWSADNNHVDELQRALARLGADHPGRVALGYALAKELEDLQDWDASFAALADAARVRRARLAYRVESDEDAMAAIAAAFDARTLARRAPAPPAGSTEPSLFVMGLPRSGTTLVERILDSHPLVGSIGESNAFAFALMRLAAGPGGKLAMVERSAHLDAAALGEAYRGALRSHGLPADRRLILNKTPSNYLYLGLIHQALPQAKVVHLTRHPMDSCYAMFKTLFRMGYPFSYSLEDLGRYYVAYHRLMQHWRREIPQSLHELAYEELVAEQESKSRALLDYCGLPWDQACLDFHRNAAPATSASATQVRRPIYKSSVQLWRRYERQLAPLREHLENHGIACD